MSIKCVEISGAGRGEEGVDDSALRRQVAVGDGGGAPHPAAGPAGQLTGGRRRLVDDGGDVFERDAEHVVEHEGETLGRLEALQDDQQRHTYRIGEEGLLFGVMVIVGADDWFWQPGSGEVLAPDLAGAQHVDADASDCGRQPGREIVDGVAVGSVQSQPGFLHRVVGLGE